MDVIILFKNGQRQVVSIEDDEADTDQEAIDIAKREAKLGPERMHEVDRFLIERPFI